MQADAKAGASESQGRTFRKQCSHLESQNLRVFVRIRPPHVVPASAKGRPNHDHGDLHVLPSSETELLMIAPNKEKRTLTQETFSFTRVYDAPTSQKEYFEGTTAALVDDLVSFQQKDSVIMSYGSSGSGKTYTMQGSEKEPGLLTQAIQLLYTQMAGLPTPHNVSVSCYEVYNDHVIDLLDGLRAPSAVTGKENAFGKVQVAVGKPISSKPKGLTRFGGVIESTNQLKVREDSRGRICIPGLSELTCKNEGNVLNLHRAAVAARQQASTGVNLTSSRSHFVFTLKLTEGSGTALGVGPSMAGARAMSVRSSRLSFVDLAGCERAGRTNNTGGRLKESVSINSSLMTLGRCLEALKFNQGLSARAAPSAAKVIPFRESKITHLFRDVLHGWGNLVLSVNVSPVPADFEETHHVVKYAALAATITLAVSVPQPQMYAPMPASNNEVAAADVGVSEEIASENQQLRARVAQLELELAQLYNQLQEAEAHLFQAEEDVRDEVVSEIQGVITELRSSYDEQIQELTTQLEEQDGALCSAQEEAQVLKQELAVARKQVQEAVADKNKSVGARKSADTKAPCSLGSSEVAAEDIVMKSGRSVGAKTMKTGAAVPSKCEGSKECTDIVTKDTSAQEASDLAAAQAMCTDDVEAQGGGGRKEKRKNKRTVKHEEETAAEAVEEAAMQVPCTEDVGAQGGGEKKPQEKKKKKKKKEGVDEQVNEAAAVSGPAGEEAVEQAVGDENVKAQDIGEKKKKKKKKKSVEEHLEEAVQGASGKVQAVGEENVAGQDGGERRTKRKKSKSAGENLEETVPGALEEAQAVSEESMAEQDAGENKTKSKKNKKEKEQGEGTAYVAGGGAEKASRKRNKEEWDGGVVEDLHRAAAGEVEVGDEGGRPGADRKNGKRRKKE